MCNFEIEVPVLMLPSLRYGITAIVVVTSTSYQFEVWLINYTNLHDVYALKLFTLAIALFLGLISFYSLIRMQNIT